MIFLLWLIMFSQEKNSEETFTNFYAQLVNNDRSVHQQLHDKKSYILHEHMAGELNNLHQLFLEMNLIKKDVADKVQPELLKDAIAEFLLLMASFV